MQTVKTIPIKRTTSTLHITFIGNFTDSEIQNVTDIVSGEMATQKIYFNDISCRYWSFDYKSACGYWIENIEWVDSWQHVNCLVLSSSKYKKEENI